MACNRCKGTSSDPFNFLLSCSGCGKKWHHRCHIPPLADAELIALIRATNDNDVDNGLSSWIGRCCKRKRVRAQENPETKAPIRSASASVVEVPQPRSLSVTTVSELPVDKAPIHEVSQQKNSLSSGVATPPKPGDGLTASDLGLHKPGTWVGSQLLRSTTLPSTSSARSGPPSSSNEPSAFVPYSRLEHLRERSLALARASSSVESIHTQAPSELLKHSQYSPFPGGIDPPMLDLRALSLNRAPGPSKAPSRLLLHRTAASKPPSPPPLVLPEDDEMDDLYGPPLGLPSLHAPSPPPQPSREPPVRPSPSLRLPAVPEPLVLPVLAARDPYVLAALERQEQREAARPRRGTRKVQATYRAGKKRGGFVLVADRPGGEATWAKQASRWTIARM